MKDFIFGLQQGLDLLENKVEALLRGHRTDSRGDSLRLKVSTIMEQIKKLKDFVTEKHEGNLK